MKIAYFSRFLLKSIIQSKEKSIKRYIVEKKYVRVSEVLARLQSFDHIPEQVLSAKQTLGSNVHAAIKDFVDGHFPLLTHIEFRYFQSFEKWKEVANPLFISTEQRYWDDAKMLTGQIDALVKLEGEETSVLIDFKTSAQESPLIWRMQAHLYYYLLTQNNICNLSKRFLFVKLDKKGKFPLVCEYKFSQKTLDKCLREVDLYWEEKNLL